MIARHSACFWVVVCACLAVVTRLDAQTDEIQVYTGGLETPGKANLTVHANYTPDGRTAAEFTGGVVAQGSVNGALEWAYGVSNWFEAGTYLPVYTVTRDHKPQIDGVKLRALFAVPRAQARHFFYGVNFELSHNSQHWEEKRYSGEIRPIIGTRGRNWELIVNPILDTSFNNVRQPRGQDDFLAHVLSSLERRLDYHRRDDDREKDQIDELSVPQAPRGRDQSYVVPRRCSRQLAHLTSPLLQEESADQYLYQHAAIAKQNPEGTESNVTHTHQGEASEKNDAGRRTNDSLPVSRPLLKKCGQEDAISLLRDTPASERQSGNPADPGDHRQNVQKLQETVPVHCCLFV